MGKEWQLIQLRDERKISQKVLAGKLSIDVATYRKKENGESEFKCSEMFLISKYFSLPMEKIFFDSSTRKVDF